MALNSATPTMNDTQVSTAVNDKYSSIARASSNSCPPKQSCCSSKGNTVAAANDHNNRVTNGAHTNGNSSATSYASRVATSFGYTQDQLASLPPDTNLGLSCGNPLALQTVQHHETILDLGSGGGLDCLIAARAMVAASQSSSTPLTGRVIGIDQSADMIKLATRNVTAANLPSRSDGSNEQNTTAPNNTPSSLVTFINAPITSIPLPSLTANLIISNCVINLVPHPSKPLVFAEIHRLLALGGRVAISDILAHQPLPAHIRDNVALHVGCVAGAATVDEYRRWMIEAGFKQESVVFKANGSDLNAYKLSAAEREEMAKNGDSDGCCGAGGGCGANIREKGKLFDEEVDDIDFNEWVASFEIYAVKN